ncbi:MAG: helix-turn-helix transcriptional regulator, partial [Chloroflexota bacterium]|nr:helix-turn-helix transcriptional regulator [Chloroflexota bacterium]
PPEPAPPPRQAPPSPPARGKSPDLLTRREREVAALIARGLTNRQIAAALIVGERTVDTHAANILRKLNFATRAQVAAWAVEQRLPAPDRG